MNYTVYILFSPTHQKIYIGYTLNLINRFKSHNELGTKDWIRSYKPWLVIYSECHEQKEEALKKKSLKNGKDRKWIWVKIKSQFESDDYIFD